MNKSKNLELSHLESDLSGGSDEQLLATGGKKDVQIVLLDFSMVFTISAQGTIICDIIPKIQVNH